MSDNLTERQREVLDHVAQSDSSIRQLAAELGIERGTIQGHFSRIRAKDGYDVYYSEDQDEYLVERPDETEETDEPWESESVAETDPDPSELSEREKYIVRELQTGTESGELANELDTRESVVHRHLRELRSRGWSIYRDETANAVTIEGDLTLRSSEHKGTRTRKANRWWEKRHNALVRDFRALDRPSVDLDTTTGDEDWVHVIGDVHAGDEVYTPGPDPKQVYDTTTVQRIFRYDTRKSLELADYHGANYGTAHLVWNGDFVTNEGIYTGQFEDLDAWLDEQHDCLMEPMLEQANAYAERFDRVNIVCQVGNHGENRANGTSKQANADLILYKSVRNAIAAVRKFGDGTAFENVNFRIGRVRPYVNFPLRGGDLTFHARHGQDRKPQAVTRAGHDEWVTTLQGHDFDVGCINHHHISGEIPWDGPPVIVSGSPKPPGDFVDKIAGATSLDPRERAREIGQCFGVADHGVSGRYPVKTHDFQYITDT